MGTSIAILALTAMKIMLTGGISDEILEGVLEKAADMGIDKAEEQLEQYKKGFNLNTQMDVCNVPYPKRDKVRDSIKAFMNYIELEKIAEACGADLDRFANELMNLYDLMYKENGENYEYIAKVLRNLAEHVLKNMDVKSYHEKKFLEICHAELKSELTETIEDTAAKSVEEIKKYIDEAVDRKSMQLEVKNDVFFKNKKLEDETGKINERIENKKNKVFISYSWTPENNKRWVEQLVKRLESDGVQVVIDYNDLKLGYDKYAFMERIVNDQTIKKVLIICNKTYKEKADARIGGVGGESVIITSQMYGNVRQEKFIPVVNEYDEDGKPYLPYYLSSRMYADLTEIDSGYKELLNNILGGEKEENSQGLIKTRKSIATKRDIDCYDKSTTFFDYRFSKAFPGIRMVEEFANPKDCVDRLEILLKNPLKREGLSCPIWWFRGSRNLQIQKFSRLSENKFLMNNEEIKVNRIVVYGTVEYYKKFVYVEANHEKTIGLYDYITEEYVDEARRAYGEYHEEYALYNGRAITRAEYDDDAAVIDGKVVDLQNKAELRVRHLTPYNFIICAQFHPINRLKNDSIMKRLLDGILEGEKTVEDIVDFVDGLSRHRNDM